MRNRRHIKGESQSKKRRGGGTYLPRIGKSHFIQQIFFYYSSLYITARIVLTFVYRNEGETV